MAVDCAIIAMRERVARLRGTIYGGRDVRTVYAADNNAGLSEQSTTT